MNKQQGAGLIEVLIALLVLAIGLLGLGALQTQSLRFNNESYFRTQATLLAMDMADRLRANRDYARTNSANYTFTVSDTSTSAINACESSACSPGELAQYDFKQWKDRVEQALPGGTVSLAPVSPPPPPTGVTPPPPTDSQAYKIEISYRATDNTAATPQTFTYRVRI